MYSSLESTQSVLSATGSSANAVVKDPFLKAEKKARATNRSQREKDEEAKQVAALNQARAENERNKRAAAALQQAQYASDNVLGALSGVGSRFEDMRVEDEGKAEDDGWTRAPKGGRDVYSSEEEDERVVYSSDDSELDVEDDIDMTLMQREFNEDESFDEEEDATLQKR